MKEASGAGPLGGEKDANAPGGGGGGGPDNRDTTCGGVKLGAGADVEDGVFLVGRRLKSFSPNIYLAATLERSKRPITSIRI